MDLFRDEHLHQQKRRRIGTVEEDDEKSVSIESLPLEIVYFILSRLPITSLVQFTCVSRAWRTDPDLAVAHFSATSRSREDPVLIFHGLCPIQNQLSFFADHLNSTTKGNVKKLILPFLADMPDFDVVGSCNGLLCLSDSLYVDILYVYNPFTNLCKRLPMPVQYSAQEVALGFGYSKLDKQYKVVRVVYYRKTAAVAGASRISYSRSQIQMLSLGGGETWRDLGRAPFQIDCSSSSSSALVDGRLYWMTRRRWDRGVRTRTIVSFDFEDEQFRQVPKPDCGGLDRWNFHLLVLQGRLAATVFESSGKFEIWALMAGDGGWTKEYDVGAYLPKELKRDTGRRRAVLGPKNVMEGRFGRVVWVLKNGNILIEYRNRVVVSYDPQRNKFQDLAFHGLPNCFQTIVLMGSLNQIHTPIHHTSNPD